MSDLSAIFTEGCKVVVSPDKMRAWITLVRPKARAYTAEAVAEWLPQHGVVYGADAGLIKQALASGRYDELLEVARGKPPVAATGGDYTIKVDKKPFTGLKGSSDGALFYDDLSFLQEVQPGQVLAEIVPPTPAEDGVTVTGEAVPPREGAAGRTLAGGGFAMAEDGKTAVAPALGHVNIVGNELIVTPLHKVGGLSKEDGELEFAGNVLVTGDVLSGASISAGGSVFVAGRTVSASIKAGNNVLLCGGMRSEGGFGRVEAKGSVWGLFFESCEITAGGDVCANHLSGCEVAVQGRASILGGRGAVASTTLYAKDGVVAGVLGDPAGSSVSVSCGLNKAFLDRYTELEKRIDRMGTDIQAIQQGIATLERLNRTKPDRGRSDPQYKEMVKRRDQSLGVQKILGGERTRMRRSIEQASVTTVVVREGVYPGVTLSIDTREYTVKKAMKRVRFRRTGEEIAAAAVPG